MAGLESKIKEKNKAKTYMPSALPMKDFSL